MEPGPKINKYIPMWKRALTSSASSSSIPVAAATAAAAAPVAKKALHSVFGLVISCGLMQKTIKVRVAKSKMHPIVLKVM